MMLHHVSVGARDVSKAAAFYDKVLSALGYKRVMDFMPHAVAYGADSKPEFWVSEPENGGIASAGNGVHVSFMAKNKQAIQAFYDAALKSGGSDEGAPGPRPDYGPDYYGAFARDPDGNKIEAVLTTEVESEHEDEDEGEGEEMEMGEEKAPRRRRAKPAMKAARKAPVRARAKAPARAAAAKPRPRARAKATTRTVRTTRTTRMAAPKKRTVAKRATPARTRSRAMRTETMLVPVKVRRGRRRTTKEI